VNDRGRVHARVVGGLFAADHADFADVYDGSPAGSGPPPSV